MAPNSISIIASDGKWLVRVVESDGVAGEREFGIEEHARSYAAGQKVRLGIKDKAPALAND
ncbi:MULTISPECIES: hypothetical protein [unclassified Rhizobium]|uniref:hypothetical protein n=1 Tax=unclassified Rhizobium TaxID=2613769 RepID=UPI0006F57AA7|nr:MULTISPECIES: hypothetical protein [unclassified Rhizobium]KQV43578.1 hypothetical protein ASC86_01855 [Rhizobium sp. Root1212]KRD37762.1 hypothetical protein ASE37_01855 [Rhizobium sp. Root268]